MLHVCYFRKLPNLATRVSIYNSYIAVTLVHLICPCHPYYDVLQIICLEAFLYWLQTFDLKDHEVEWVTTHFGHTLKVHKVSYRQTSSAIERTQIAKLLLLQDHAMVGKFANCRLEDIDIKGLWHHPLTWAEFTTLIIFMIMIYFIAEALICTIKWILIIEMMKCYQIL